MVVRRLPDALKVRAERQPDDVAHDDLQRQLTFRQWDREADEVAGGLVAAGLMPNEPVFLAIDNSNAVEMAIAWIAVMRAGAIAAPVSSRLALPELSDYARLIEPRFAITNAVDKIAPLKLKTWSVTDMPRDLASLPDQSRFSPQGDAQILGTSGTTGKIKGVVISHADLLGHVDGMARQRSSSTLHAMPFTGTGGNLGLLKLPIRSGATIITQPHFEVAQFLDLVEQRRPSAIFLVPAMLRLLLGAPDIETRDFSSVGWLLTGTAPLPNDSVRRALELWPHIEMRNQYGMSEGGARAKTRSREALLKPGCVGKLGAHLQVRDANGVVCAVGEVGEIYGKSSTPRRYWRDKDATAAAWIGGWTKSGDLGYVDEDGDLILCGRSKELIIRGGYNITPMEVEHVLHAHPNVKHAAVVGVAHDVLGEDVAAAIVLQSDAKLGADDLQAWCRERLADNKVPRTICFVEDMPFNQNGKIIKGELKPLLERAAADRRASQQR